MKYVPPEVHLAPEEHQLMIELAVMLARHAHAILEPMTEPDDIPFPDGFVSHFYLSTFIEVDEVLDRLGVLHQRPTGAPNFLFKALSEAEIRTKLAAGIPDKTLPLLRVLTTYLSMTMAGYGASPELLSDSKDAFEPYARYRSDLEILAAYGYAEKLGTCFRWTQKINEAMEECGAWTPDGRTRSQVYEEQRTKAATKLKK